MGQSTARDSIRNTDPRDIQRVGEIGMFIELSPAQISAVLEKATVQIHAGPGLLFSQGDVADRFFILLDGMVTLSIYREDGSHALVETIYPGHTFAEAAAFVFRTYPVTAEFTAGTEIIGIPFDDLMDKLTSVEGLSMAVLGSLARWENELSRQLDSLKLHPPTKRLCRELLALLDDAGAKAGGGVTVTLPYDKGHLAKRLGITAESLSRILARLTDLGIRTNGRNVTISDVEIVQRYCQNPGRRTVS